MEEPKDLKIDKDWHWIKRVIYLEAKKYTTQETALNIARDVMDYLIAKGVRLDTEKCNNTEVGKRYAKTI